jgi:hypothetical protein
MQATVPFAILKGPRKLLATYLVGECVLTGLTPVSDASRLNDENDELHGS